MFRNYLFIVLVVLSFHLDAYEHIELPAVETPTFKASTIKPDGLLKYALSTPLETIDQSKLNSRQIKWTPNADGWMEYTLRLSADKATSINVGMTDFFLPPSAELWISNDDKSILRGPYTDRYNPKNGHFWIGDVPGDHVNLTFTVKPTEHKYLTFNLAQVARGFYAYWKSPQENSLKSGNCNIDVACPEGDDWRPEISSVGQYSFQVPNVGSYVCTGQLINNTAQDGTPYFLTASHCGYTNSTLNDKDSIAASIYIIWNYESETCRTPGSYSSGDPISKSNFNQRQAGATFIANNPASDFALVRLNQTPDAEFNIQYTGWDRSDTAFIGGTSIHHPSAHAKRISIDFDPLIIMSFNDSGVVTAGNTHLQVTNWDLGITEQGSSGGGLWNNDFRLVGQLSGGTLGVCGDDITDWYGRLYYSWDKGTTPQTRLKDWLDPIETNQLTIDTSDRCDAPTVTINPPNTIKAGTTTQFTAHATGGTGNYQYSWDLNGDGQANGHGKTISTRYSQGYVGNVILTVKDDSGCQAVDSRAVIVKAPDIQVQSSAELTQICGNNDSHVDPGERWRARLTAQNVGDQSATGAYLMFDGQPNQINDNFGNKASVCDTEFIDISKSGTPYNWIKGPVSNATADDEGYAVIQLNQAFKHYDQNVSTLVASTNGYLNTYAYANGIDWDNDCPLPANPDKDSTGGRIAVMHDDLNSSQFYHQHFNDCPRDAESGDNLACDVFLWKGAYFYGSGAIDSMDIQGILYPATSQWVFQHRGPGADGATSTVGIQNDVASDGLNFACNTPNSLSADQAVCIFHKDHINLSDDSLLTLETPAIALNSLGSNDSTTFDVDFSVDDKTLCGSELSINHTASVFDQGFNTGQPDVIQFEIGDKGQCQVVNQCEINDDNTVTPKTGLWWNHERTGNGVEMHVIDNDRLLYIMYTGRPDGSPIWYTADNDDSAHNLFYNDIYEVSYPGGFTAGDKQFSHVGWSNTYLLDPLNALQVRSVNGQLSAEKLTYQQLDNQVTINQYTGHYYAPTDSGWGQSVITEGRYRVIVSYLYDQDGNPYWTYASGLNDNSTFTAGHFNTFCPDCPWVEPDAQAAGELKMEFSGPSQGLINFYDIQYPAAPLSPIVNWQRSQLPVVNRNALP